MDNFGRLDSNQALFKRDLKYNLIVEKFDTQNKENFNQLISNVRGDLNNDGVDDLIRGFKVNRKFGNEDEPFLLAELNNLHNFSLT